MTEHFWIYIPNLNFVKIYANDVDKFSSNVSLNVPNTWYWSLMTPISVNNLMIIES